MIMPASAARALELGCTNAKLCHEQIVARQHAFGAASTVGCKEPIRVNELGSLSALPFFAALTQLDYESLAGCFSEICIRRTHIASSFSISKKLCICHFSQTGTERFYVERPVGCEATH
jgi:hypothetical protein